MALFRRSAAAAPGATTDAAPTTVAHSERAPLSRADLARLDRIREGLASFKTDTRTPAALSALLDRTSAEWLAVPSKRRPDPEPSINIFGVALGDHLCRVLDGHWVAYSDADGAELAVEVGEPGTDGPVLFPIASVARRWGMDSGWLPAFVAEVTREVAELEARRGDAVGAAAPAAPLPPVGAPYQLSMNQQGGYQPSVNQPEPRVGGAYVRQVPLPRHPAAETVSPAPTAQPGARPPVGVSATPPPSSPQVDALAQRALDHAVGTVTHGGPVTTFALVEDAGGGVELTRFAGDPLETPELARRHVRSATGVRVAVAWGGVLTVGGVGTPAVFVEASGRGEASLLVAQRYEGAPGAAHTAGPPVLVGRRTPLC